MRGKSNKGYYLLEKEACEKNAISMIDFRVYSRDVHSIETIVNAQKLFSEIEYPAIMHCKSGADRTGFMGVLYKHFHMKEPIEVAISQLSLKYLHIKQGKTQIERNPYFFPKLSINKNIISKNIDDILKNIEELSYDDFIVTNYNCYDRIKAEMVA